MVKLVLLLNCFLLFEPVFVADVAFKAESESDYGVTDAVGCKRSTEIDCFEYGGQAYAFVSVPDVLHPDVCARYKEEPMNRKSFLLQFLGILLSHEGCAKEAKMATKIRTEIPICQRVKFLCFQDIISIVKTRSLTRAFEKKSPDLDFT
ncbi:hypothetical protein BpHYR1_010974 [Brachionus plicatilis]|uniref:Uncharacterized protein n=1 Tax=Brachionus plicatilis TaxID=10195 RepID=A0A3M7T0Z6_BRAPC|nr:hypothetical protein BpHYR1_010974 [Brachionus plicatilis]